MSETVMHADTPDGRVDARLFLPEGEGAWPLVVFYVDAGGMRPAMSTMGARLASAGFAVLQPNPFWRSAPYAPFDARTVFGDPPERARLMALVSSVVPSKVVDDTRALVAALAADPRILTDRIGAIGYCMGGRLAFIASSAWPEKIAAVAAIHAGGLVSDSPESPHRAAPQIRAALYLGVADEDPSCTPEHQRVLRESLDEAGARHQLELYAGARHGFAVPDVPPYDEAASEKHWERVITHLRTHLGASEV